MRQLVSKWTVERVPRPERVWVILPDDDGDVRYGWLKPDWNSAWTEALIHVDNSCVTISPTYAEQWGVVSAVDQLGDLARE